ncbi:ABC transporter permease [Jeotgalibaca sp. A127]|uniref:ABC transporter permease n=1 Tax=Jeotgalibaca sp. A127 TaxID=3457324 RepID=UPI003FD43C0C
MIDYWNNYSSRLITATWDHIELVGITLLISILISGGIVLACLVNERVMSGIIYFFSLIYSVPSLALFAILIPLTGLGKDTAIIVLVIYCQYILLRNFATGLSEVDPVMVETAIGMGMTHRQVFRKIQLPLAANAIIAGIRIAATSTIGIATIAATINAGGLGTILFDGLRTLNVVKLLWGTLLAVGLCVVVNVVLYAVEYQISKRMK